MKHKILKITYFCMLVACGLGQNTAIAQQKNESDQYRPAFHFTPKSHWMNDPNGMVYLNGKYHLFYQHNPNSSVWGPMHWGHATSTDLDHWDHQPIALYPDSLGTIFSGSAVVDVNNTAGFGKNALVAIFTHHNHKIEEAKTGLHQYQSIAYSIDEGKTWTKYEGNPVLPNPGIWDFRDPKVMWHTQSKKWIMTLATKDRITFYSSPNLKNWTKESEFGEKSGAHGGVWECPDLFPLSVNGIQKWVLLVSINPGGPAGGSGTQYFVGDFKEGIFSADHTDIRWLDYGADNYAGVTWSNTGNRKIFMGWMNNWTYANQIPEQGFRGATTIARELQLKKVGNEVYLSAAPVKEFNLILDKAAQLKYSAAKTDYDLSTKVTSFKGKYQLELTTAQKQSFSLRLTNDNGDELVLGYDAKNNTFYTDRTKSGQVDFEKSFPRVTTAPRISKDNHIQLKLILDVTSAEVFADNGLTVMTNTFFAHSPLTQLHIKSTKPLLIQNLKYAGIKSL
ncbi:glycoside hydrolase family 32 protein [Pedobacter sp. HDW13]|uniref:glycoside hydrolase family 32 protein n=1 Tax=Pedobacter sp. HDW13 TaxID=2714940 RepID=UPI00140E8901|nr:glycoside hydrolase family 32 protein [Pedobacter sp. HDW13]QIL37976.1 glycoside hydrolase family 32 protein [Pedobacter sp. HDW13]